MITWVFIFNSTSTKSFPESVISHKIIVSVLFMMIMSQPYSKPNISWNEFKTLHWDALYKVFLTFLKFSCRFNLFL